MDDTTYSQIPDNLQRIHDAIADACARSSRDPHNVTLVAVSKRHPAEAVTIAYQAGVRHFGENRIEEAQTKMPQVQSLLDAPDDITWHMIGHIQSRKAKSVVSLFDCTHSIDTLKLARRLSHFAQEADETLRIMLEINISGEVSKAGFAAADWQTSAATRQALWQVMKAVQQLPNLKLMGLMTMAPFLDDPQATRPYFSSLAALRDAAQMQLGILLPELSMGMTNDFTVAIEEGATQIRIGTALFGARQY